MARRLLASALALAFAALTAAACNGGGNPYASPTPSGSMPGNADELVLQVGIGGGLVPDAVRYGEWPYFNLYGDGTLITQGPQIEIYPPPALPAMVSQHIDEAGMEAIVEAAREAGLTDGDAQYSNAQVMDAGTTTFVVNAGGVTSTTAVYALGIPPAPNDPMPADEREELDKIVTFNEQLGSLATWLPDGSLGPEEPYTPEGLMVFAMPYAGAPDPNLEQPDKPWPLDTPLSEFGEPMDAPKTRCGVVTGDDFDALWSAAEQANQLTPWTSENETYSIYFRPKLPNERECG